MSSRAYAKEGDQASNELAYVGVEEAASASCVSRFRISPGRPGFESPGCSTFLTSRG